MLMDYIRKFVRRGAVEEHVGVQQDVEWTQATASWQRRATPPPLLPERTCGS